LPDLATAALIRKRAEMAGEAKSLAARCDQLRVDMVHLDATIRIMCPEMAKPKVPGRGGSDWFGRGELGRMVLDTLREATAPMQVEAITRTVIAAKGLPADAKALRRVENMVKGALHRQNGLAVARVGDGRDIRWQLIQVL
jgi:hypothetical protein